MVGVRMSIIDGVGIIRCSTSEREKNGELKICWW